MVVFFGWAASGALFFGRAAVGGPMWGLFVLGAAVGRLFCGASSGMGLFLDEAGSGVGDFF